MLEARFSLPKGSDSPIGPLRSPAFPLHCKSRPYWAEIRFENNGSLLLFNSCGLHRGFAPCGGLADAATRADPISQPVVKALIINDEEMLPKPRESLSVGVERGCFDATGTLDLYEDAVVSGLRKAVRETDFGLQGT
jgi:hypothetical protein